MSARKRVKITNKKHPHYGEYGYLVKEDVPLSLSFLGKSDLIHGDYQDYLGKEPDFFARKTDYQIISTPPDRGSGGKRREVRGEMGNITADEMAAIVLALEHAKEVCRVEGYLGIAKEVEEALNIVQKSNKGD